MTAQHRVFHHVSKEFLKPKQVELIKQSDKYDPDQKLHNHDVVDMVVEGIAELWEYSDSDGGHGIVVTALTTVDGRKKVCLWRFIGYGLAGNLDLIFDELDYYAKKHSCKEIYSITTLDHIVKMAKDAHVMKVHEENNGVYTLVRKV